MASTITATEAAVADATSEGLLSSYIGTYQVFQETYHHATYAGVHPPGTIKSDYLWRLDALDRAYERPIKEPHHALGCN